MTLPRVLLVDEPAQRLDFYRSAVGDLAALTAADDSNNLFASLRADYAVVVLNFATTAACIRAHPGMQRTPLLVVGTTAGAAPHAAITGPVDFLPTAADVAALRTKVRLFAQLHSAAAQLAQLHEQYLSIMLHELRTPLNAILGWTTLLRTGRVDAPTCERALEIVERNARTQAQLIEALQDESRIIAGEVQLELAQVDPRKVVDAAVITMAPAAQARQVTLTTDFAQPAVSVNVDSARLQQLLGHLLANAIRVSPPGAEVQVRLEHGAAQIRISVADSGSGIAPDILPQLFDRFRQDEGSAGRRRSGRGLGLTLVRRLAELHGGTVSAHSAGEGQGATFTVRLPSRSTS